MCKIFYTKELFPSRGPLIRTLWQLPESHSGATVNVFSQWRWREAEESSLPHCTLGSSPGCFLPPEALRTFCFQQSCPMATLPLDVLTHPSGLSPDCPSPWRLPWPSWLGSTNSKSAQFVSGDDNDLQYSIFLSRPFHRTVNSLKAGNAFLLCYCSYNMWPCTSTKKIFFK